MQLLAVHEDGSDSLGNQSGTVSAFDGHEQGRDVRMEYGDGAALFLSGVRYRGVSGSAARPQQAQRQRSMHRRGGPVEVED